MKITLTSIMVKDQNHALEFYTKILGFVKRMTSRWASSVG